MITALWWLAGLLFVGFGMIVFRGAPYVPTHRRQLKLAFTSLYPLSKKDTVVDLGSGDGVVLAVAADAGAGAIGYELNPFLVMIAKWRLRAYSRATVKMQDFLTLTELPEQVTVVYAFTTGHNIEQIGRKMEEWSSTRQLAFISYGFALKNKQTARTEGAMHLYFFGPSKA